MTSSTAGSASDRSTRTRTPLHGHLGALGAILRHAPVARGHRLGRDPRRARRPRHHGGRQPARRVRDPRLRHAARDRPDRVEVRVRAGRRPQHRLRRTGGPAARHARAQGRDREGDRADPDAPVQARRPTRPASRASATPSARTRSPTTGASPTPRRSSTRRSRTRTATRSSPSRTPSARRSPPSA